MSNCPEGTSSISMPLASSMIRQGSPAASMASRMVESVMTFGSGGHSTMVAHGTGV